MCKDFPIALYNMGIEYKRMSNLSMGLCEKLATSVVWYTFAPLDSDLYTG